MNKRTEERVWCKHVLRLTMGNKRLRKLLNCNICITANKTCKVVVELHITYTLTIAVWYIVDNKQEITSVTTEWK